jgi:hypothetical protein
MAKFKRYDGLGNTAINVNGILRFIGPKEVIEVKETDEIFSFLINDKKWELINEITEKIVVEEKIVEKKILTINDLTSIKGVGNVRASIILDGGNKQLSWYDLKRKGKQYFIDLLKDDVANVLWDKICKEDN